MYDFTSYGVLHLLDQMPQLQHDCTSYGILYLLDQTPQLLFIMQFCVAFIREWHLLNSVLSVKSFINVGL